MYTCTLYMYTYTVDMYRGRLQSVRTLVQVPGDILACFRHLRPSGPPTNLLLSISASLPHIPLHLSMSDSSGRIVWVNVVRCGVCGVSGPCEECGVTEPTCHETATLRRSQHPPHTVVNRLLRHRITWSHNSSTRSKTCTGTFLDSLW